VKVSGFAGNIMWLCHLHNLAVFAQQSKSDV